MNVLAWFKPFRIIADYLNDMAGVPNYKRYINHFRKYHPNEIPLSEKEFHKQATDEKYGGGSIRRCC
ncbi:YbdD/YjiX family protein [Shimazuella alba]|uniref:Putative selenoprotein n=1 Tax=Shimazuella alba TaxID=2690964 RepID=A0A6I4VQT6_9BACL|nr:YbdD/YjiX family protein [Shimazuella alba]MXQ52635.1 putative selenoprotein [Shimazuella alba]